MNTIIGPMIYYHCNDCGSLYRSCLESDPSELYSHNYYSFKQPTAIRSKTSALLDTIFIRIRSKILYRLLRGGSPLPSLLKLNLLRDKSLWYLDIGSGTGNLVRKLRALGFINSYGIDPYLPCDSELVSKQTLLDTENIHLYDIVMYNHSLEHAPDWNDQLLFLSSTMKRGSKLLIRVPVVNFLSKFLKGTWGQLDPKHHLNLFTLNGLSIFLESIGFTTKATLYDSYYFMFTESIASASIIFNMPPTLARLVRVLVDNRLSYLIFNILAIPFNVLRCSDQVSILAEKIH